eukprot:s2238_g17.t1
MLRRGTAFICIVCADSLLVYSVADAQTGTAKQVCENVVDGDAISMTTWKEDTLICVFGSGRVQTIQPDGGGNYNNIHENTEFSPSCAAALPRSDLVLLGGKPPDEDMSNFWAVDIISATSWQVYLEQVPASMEDAFYYGHLCGMAVVPRRDWQADKIQ